MCAQRETAFGFETGQGGKEKNDREAAKWYVNFLSGCFFAPRPESSRDLGCVAGTRWLRNVEILSR